MGDAAAVLESRIVDASTARLDAFDAVDALYGSSPARKASRAAASQMKDRDGFAASLRSAQTPWLRDGIIGRASNVRLLLSGTRLFTDDTAQNMIIDIRASALP